MSDRICTVKIVDWDSDLLTLFQVTCRECDRSLGSFSKHESAMAWAQAHATGSKHLRR